MARLVGTDLPRPERAYYHAFLVAILLCWSPSKGAAYAAPFVGIGLYVVEARVLRPLAAVAAWIAAFALLAAVHAFLVPHFVWTSAGLAAITYGVVLILWAVPTRRVAGDGVVGRMATVLRWVIVLEGLLGIVQAVYGFGHTGSFDVANGDYVEGTISPGLGPSATFSNPMFAANMALALVLLVPLTRRPRHWAALVVGGLALVLASVLHVLLVLGVGAVIATIVVPPRWRALSRRAALAVAGAVVFGLAVVGAFLASNVRTAPALARAFASGNSPRAQEVRLVLSEMPRAYRYQPFIGLGPGQFSSRAGLIGTGLYLGGIDHPDHLPLLPTGISGPQRRFLLGPWRRAASLPHVSSFQEPFFSWQSVYTEFGWPGLVGVAAFVGWLLARVRGWRRRPGRRALGWAVAAGTLVLFLLGFTENYWEVPQAILIGAMLLKAEYAAMGNADPVRAEPGGPGQRASVERVPPASRMPAVAPVGVVRADAVVVAYRSSQIIGRCLEALRADGAVDTIVVVNNSPGDETEQRARAVDRMVYLDSPRNLGFGRAVNSARPHVRHPYVVLANPDAIQEPGTAGALLDFLERHPLAGAVAPRMTDADGTPFPNSQRDLSLGRLIAESAGLPASLGVARPLEQHERAHRTEYVIGSYLVTRAKAMDEIGWFDESIFLFGEDLDLCRRMRRAGWEVWFAPVGRVRHLSGHSWKQLPDRARSLFIEARHRELRKARGPVEAEIYRFLVTAKEGMRRHTGGVAS